MNTEETFAQRLQSAMQSKGIQQKELADLAKISPSSISFWILHGKIPYRPTLERVATLLEVHPHWLLTGEGPRDAPATKKAEPQFSAPESPALRSARERVEILKLQIEEAELRKKLAELEGTLPIGVTPAGFPARKDKPAPGKKAGRGARSSA